MPTAPTSRGGGRVVGGRYELLGVIGRGGMSSVWAGRDRVLDREVALKRVGLLPGGDTPDLARAEREARLAARLDHTHVVLVFDLIDDGDEQWLVMEHIEGRNLAQLVDEEGPLPPDAAARLLGQAADALSAAHRAGIVHRDVKPSNILVTPHGQVKLTDFGIARAHTDATLTATGLMTGSPAYLSPEVASGRSATAASDVWAFGATLFHALTGRPPYDARDNVMGTLFQIVTEEPPRPPAAGWLAPVLERTMAKDPDHRWSMAEVRDHLVRGPAATAPSQAPPPPVPISPAVASPHTARPGPASPGPASPGPASPGPASPGPASPAVASRAPASIAPAPPQHRRRRRRGPGALLAGLLALVVVIGLGWWLVTRSSDGSGTDQAAARASSSTSSASADGPATSAASDPADPATSPENSPSSPTTSPTSSPTSSPGTGSPGTGTTPPATSESMAAFVQDYLATVTRDPATSWRTMLTPAFRSTIDGFASYTGFWSTIKDAEATSISADPASLTVTYRVTYERTDGSRTEEDNTLQLQRTPDGYRIAGEP